MLANFAKDIKYTDKNHPGMHKNTLPTYYKKYFKKPFHACEHGVKDIDALLDLFEDIIFVDPDTGLIECVQDEAAPLDIFLGQGWVGYSNQHVL